MNKVKNRLLSGTMEYNQPIILVTTNSYDNEEYTRWGLQMIAKLKDITWFTASEM